MKLLAIMIFWSMFVTSRLVLMITLSNSFTNNAAMISRCGSSHGSDYRAWDSVEGSLRRQKREV